PLARRAPIPIAIPPSSEASTVRGGMDALNFQAPAAAAAAAAPIMMPTLVRVVLSVQAEAASASAFFGSCQNAQVCGSRPNSCRNFAPHSAKAKVTPQIEPEINITAPANTASTTAPASIGHD